MGIEACRWIPLTDPLDEHQYERRKCHRNHEGGWYRRIPPLPPGSQHQYQIARRQQCTFTSCSIDTLPLDSSRVGVSPPDVRNLVNLVGGLNVIHVDPWQVTLPPTSSLAFRIIPKYNLPLTYLRKAVGSPRQHFAQVKCEHLEVKCQHEETISLALDYSRSSRVRHGVCWASSLPAS